MNSSITSTEVRTYTIDLRLTGAGCAWRLYTRGGIVLVTEGEADTIEQASAEARTALLVAHRADPVADGTDDLHGIAEASS